MLRRLVLVIVALCALAPRVPLAAHEIPRSLVVHAFVKPDGDRLRVVLRVPLAAMRDMEFPERDGSLDVARAQPGVLEAIGRWILPTLAVYEDGVRLGRPTIAATRVSLPSDRSFTSYEDALAHVTATYDPATVQLPWNQALVDALIEYPITTSVGQFSIRPGFERLGVNVLTVLRFVTPGGVRTFELAGDPGVVRLDPRWHQAAWHFVTLGFAHILDGTDHLLFLVLLVVPFRRLRSLVLIVSAFTVAHSITLIASGLGFAPDALWFPPLIETFIAASIVYLALENILSAGTPSRRWIVAFGFGLVHGFGFSFALQETLQFAGGHLVSSLLAFNVGVELAQVAVLLLLVPACQVIFRVIPERAGTIVLSALVAHTAWHWMTDRWQALRQYPAPAPGGPVLIVVVRAVLVLMIAAGVIWLAYQFRRRPKPSRTEPA